MLREVLYMLAGESGGVFATAGEDADLCGGVDICGGLPGLSPSERQQLRPLLALGSDVARLGRFVEQSQPESLYLSAVRRAVGERLAAHRQLLHGLEDEVLSGTACGATAISSRVLVHAAEMEYLAEFVDAVGRRRADCTLSDVAVRFGDRCGVVRATETLRRIGAACLAVLHRQTASWMLFGKLLDPHDEFFIRPEDTSGPEEGDWVIVGERIPGCLNATLAQQALFVGESILSLRLVQDLSEEDWAFMSELQATVAEGQVAELIARCRQHMAEKLWNQVSLQGRLSRSLSVVRNTLLMKKGDVFGHFIAAAGSLLDSAAPPAGAVQAAAAAQFALHQKLATSLAKYLVEDELELERLSLKLQPLGGGASGTATTCDAVTIEYRTEWPLGLLIFTPEAMETYNGVFRLLLKLRRVQVKLSDTWKSVWRWRNNRLLQLRWSVQHVLLHLGHYVHNDVIEVQKSIMDQRIVDCRDFDRFRMAHAQFLAVVAAQTFLHVPAMQACIHDLMELALEMCRLASAEEGAELVEEAVARLDDELRRLVQLLLTLLGGMHQRSGNAASMEPVAQLLLRLDFNHHLTQGGAQKDQTTPRPLGPRT